MEKMQFGYHEYDYQNVDGIDTLTRNIDRGKKNRMKVTITFGNDIDEHNKAMKALEIYLTS